ncbi:MAG: acyl carrier protein [Proteobacteria bacterium]|nr:acyl carrier protein [Pseudomonadota bacterium]
MSVADKIIAIIAEQAFLEPKDVKPDATLEQLGIDSMALVECIFAIEECFDVQVPFNANDPAASQFDISSIQSIIDAVEALIAAQKT